MKIRTVIGILAIALMIVLAGCKPKECTKDIECEKEHFVGGCSENKCVYQPIANECGNGLCEENVGENSCTCESDCGECKGGTGKYLGKSCQKDICVFGIKKDVKIVPTSLFEDRKMGDVNLQINYKFNSPFNTLADKIVMDVELFNLREGVSDVRITKVKALEKSSEFGSFESAVDFPSVGSKGRVDLKINKFSSPEEEHDIDLAVWYEYMKNDETVKAQFTYSKLPKIFFLSP